MSRFDTPTRSLGQAGLAHAHKEVEWLLDLRYRRLVLVQGARLLSQLAGQAVKPCIIGMS